MKEPKPLRERRGSVRIAERLPFKISGREYATEAVTVNVSTRGALCLIGDNIPVMTQLKIALSLPTDSKGARRDKVISMKGVVVRKESSASGNLSLIAVYFSEIKPADRQALEQFIKNRISTRA